MILEIDPVRSVRGVDLERVSRLLDAHAAALRLSTTRRGPISLSGNVVTARGALVGGVIAFLSSQHFGQIAANNELSLRAR